MKVGDEITIVVFERFEREATKGNPEYGSLTCDAKIVRETRTQWITAEGMRFDKGSGLGYPQSNSIQLRAVCRMNNDNNRTYEREHRRAEMFKRRCQRYEKSIANLPPNTWPEYEQEYERLRMED